MADTADIRAAYAMALRLIGKGAALSTQAAQGVQSNLQARRAQVAEVRQVVWTEKIENHVLLDRHRRFCEGNGLLVEVSDG